MPDAEKYRLLDSFASSSLSAATEASESTLSTPASSSKATTPGDSGTSSKSQWERETGQSWPARSYRRDHERLSFTVRPKSSLPTDMSAQEHASECIEAAESSRLNPYTLHLEEYHLLRHHISPTQVTTYLNIRNSILRLWLKEPWKCITRQAAVGCANARWFDAANVCYDWLVRRGYINFGCVATEHTASHVRGLPPKKRRRTVAVVGAGISGLACARQLEGLFRQYAYRFDELAEDLPDVQVLEGRARVGGRVYSREFKSKPGGGETMEFRGRRHTAEMGGMIITGFERGNPINVLARAQLGLSYQSLSPHTTLYDSDGSPVDAIRDDLVERLYNDCLDRVSEFKHKAQPAKHIEGNRDLIDDGRDSPGDGSKTIMQTEEAAAALPHALPVSEQNVPDKVNMVPVAADKLTGRVYTEPGSTTTERAAEAVKSMGWTLREGVSTDEDLDLETETSRDGSTLGSVVDYAIERYKDMVHLTAQDYRLLNWHIANLEYSNATNLHNLSLKLWDIDAGNEWEGSHTMVVGGYQSVARGLLQCPTALNVATRFPVKTIKYTGDKPSGGARIEDEQGNFLEADHVVCTLPLGVLKHGNITFEPPLPDWKTGAVKRLGFGILNKVVLVYEHIFWQSKRHIFGVLRDAPNQHSASQDQYGLNRGRFFQWFNVTNTTGLPCLIALMAGDAGFETERSGNQSLVEEATGILRNVFGSAVPYPVEAVVTRWGSDPFARGSYSSAAPEMHADDYDTMAKSIGNLVFAGEHTIGTHPATVHGAYLSGLRAASDVLESIIGPIEVPTPLILPRDSVILQKRKEAANDPRQARIEAYELEILDHIRANIGERPVGPGKLVVNGYLLYSKGHFEEARKVCEETRKPSNKSRSIPNEVRILTSKMWKVASPEERRPYEEQATAQKQAYAEALEAYNEQARQWDEKAIRLRSAYESHHPSVPGPDETPESGGTPNKYRRARNISYTEDRDTVMDG